MAKKNIWDSSLKAYAKKYDISVLDDKGKFKSVNALSNDIYKYEKEHRPIDPFYPFLRLNLN